MLNNCLLMWPYILDEHRPILTSQTDHLIYIVVSQLSPNGRYWRKVGFGHVGF